MLELDSGEERRVVGAGDMPNERHLLRLGVGLGHVEVRRWVSSQIGFRLGLTAGGVRGEYRYALDGDVLASRGSPLATFGASLGPLLATRHFVLSVAAQYLFIRARNHPERLGDLPLSNGRFSTAGVELRIGLKLPRGVELALLGRLARVVRQDAFFSFGVAILFRLFRHDSRPPPARGW